MPKLWTRNFVLAFTGTVFSAAGGIALSIALSVVVFQETQSTILAAVFAATSMVPQFLLPLVMGPIIDRQNPLRLLVANEVVLAFLFFAVALITYFGGFNYTVYIVFSVLISSFGIISQLSSGSILPQIIHPDNYMRGNAMLNIVYPLCSVAITPVAILLFDRFGMPLILAAYGVTSLIDAGLESRIKCKFEYIQSDQKGYSFKTYLGDVKDGVDYLRQDVAVRSVFFLFMFVLFADASSNLIYPFFNQSDSLTNNHYALMNSIRSAGYVLGGFLHYFIKIPSNRRFQIATFVYCLFIVLDGSFFFMPFWLMCASRFMLGIAGMNSANIRVSAVQNRVPNTYRAKVNALFSVMTSAAMMAGQLLAGALGEFLPYKYIQIGFHIPYLIGILVFLLPPKNKVRALYNYETGIDIPVQDE